MANEEVEFQGAALGLPRDKTGIVPDELSKMLTSLVDYNLYEGLNQGEYYFEQLILFADALKSLPGYAGVFATGHPFYAFNGDGGVFPVEEITNFVKSQEAKIDEDRARNIGAWPCIACQADRNLPDLKTYCKPCDDVAFKPRDLFKTAPDLDFWLIVDENSEELEIEVERRVKEAGFFTSDGNIGDAIVRLRLGTNEVMQGKTPSTTLPLDLHIVEKDVLVEALHAVEGRLSAFGTRPIIPISPRSLHVNWEQTDEPYDFMLDFLFSMTPHEWTDSDLLGLLSDSRKSARQIFYEGSDIVSFVGSLSPKVGRLLQTDTISSNLISRIASW